MADEPKTSPERLQQLLQQADNAAAGDTPSGYLPGVENMAPQTGLDTAKRSYWDSIRTPGYGTNVGGDLTKILAQGVSGAFGGAMGGPMGALAGAALNLGQIAVDPDSLRPAVGYGNAAEAALGPIFGKLTKVPFVKKALDKAPALTQSLFNAANTGTQTAADVKDRGGNVGTGAIVGAILGGGMGAAGGLASGIGRNLPSAKALEINRALESFGQLPPNANELNRKAANFLEDVTRAGIQREKAIAEGQLVEESSAVRTAMQKAADKKAPIALGQQTIALQKGADVAKAQAKAKFLATDDVNDAVDYLRLEYPTNRKTAISKLEAAKTALDELETVSDSVKHFKWYKNRVKTAQDNFSAAQNELSSVEETAAVARDLTRKTEVAGRKLAGENVATEIGASSPESIAARRADLVADKHIQQLNSLQGQAITADTQAKAAEARQGLYVARMEKLLSGHSMSSSDITPNGWRFIANAGEPGKLTLQSTLNKAVTDPELAEGMRDVLLRRDPDMLKSVRSEFLAKLFEPNRTALGGKNFPKAFDGKDLLATINDKSKVNRDAVNALFNDNEAYDTIKTLAQAAADADRLARPRWFQSPAHLALTGAGTLMFAGAGQLTNDPMKAAALIALAGGGYAVVNIPRFMERYAQSGSVFGKALSAYIKSSDPTKLPREVTNTLQGIITPFTMPGTGDRPGQLAEKPGDSTQGGLSGGLRY